MWTRPICGHCIEAARLRIRFANHLDVPRRRSGVVGFMQNLLRDFLLFLAVLMSLQLGWVIIEKVMIH